MFGVVLFSQIPKQHRAEYKPGKINFGCCSLFGVGLFGQMPFREILKIHPKWIVYSWRIDFLFISFLMPKGTTLWGEFPHYQPPHPPPLTAPQLGNTV